MQVRHFTQRQMTQLRNNYIILIVRRVGRSQVIGCYSQLTHLRLGDY